MKVKYYPAVDATWKQLNKYPFGWGVLYPDNWDGSKKWPTMYFVPGMGNLSAGTQEDIDNLFKGYDYDGSGPAGRVDAPVIADQVAAVDRYGIILVVVAYKAFFQPEHFGYMYDIVKKDFNTEDRWLQTGFSWGAGSGLKTVRDATQAARIACACACAATNEGGTWDTAKKAGVLMHLFVNTGDNNGPTAMTVTKGMVDAYNATNPAVKANYTAYNRTGHGGVEWAYTLTPPAAPGGQGMTNLTENIYQWYLDVLKNGPRPMRSGTIPTTPTNPVPPEQPTNPTLKAVLNIKDGAVITTPTLALDASASEGVTGTDWNKYVIGVLPADWGKNGGFKWTPDGFMSPKGVLSGLKNGQYKLTLAVRDAKGATSTEEINITVALDGTPAPRTITSNDGKTLKFSDGTSEAIISVTTAKATYTV